MRTEKSKGVRYLHHGINPISSATGIDAYNSSMWLSPDLVPEPDMVANAY